ncbi:hypothetical protein MT418_008358, partial [Batrachochytrium dendrobatidis]
VDRSPKGQTPPQFKMLKPNGAEGQGVGWWATLRSQNDKDIPDWFTVRGPNV